MKIAIFISSLAGGGAEKVAVILANEIARLGHQLHLVVGTNLPEKFESEVSQDVHLVKLEASRLINSVPKFANFIKVTQPEVVLAIMDIASIIAKFSIILSGQHKTRLYVREAISNEFKQDNPKETGSAFVKLLAAWTYNNANGIVSPSSDLALSIAIKFPRQKNIRHINNPVVTRSFAQQVNENSFISPWEKDAKIILSVGRLSEQKDFLTLLEAFRRLREKADYKLMILGEGPERSSLMNFISANELDAHCHLPGFISNPLPYMKHADLFVLASRYEGLPNALIQALACGATIVSTDCPTGPAEILENGKIGRLVPVGDPESLSIAMEQSLDPSASSPTRQQAIAERTLNTFDATQVAKEFIEFLQNGSCGDETMTN